MAVIRSLNFGRALSLALVLSFACRSFAAQDAYARRLVERGISAMGGRDAWERVTKGRFRSVGHYYLLEQSERPEGPYFSLYRERDEELDYANGDLISTTKVQGTLIPNGSKRTQSLSGKFGRMNGIDAAAAVERLAVGPERVLLLASVASDLELGAKERLQDIPHQTIRFRWGKVPVKVYLNEDTGLPTAVETTIPRDGYYRTWGDVTFRTVFGNWEYLPGKRLFPTLWTKEWDGIRIAEDSILKATFEEGERNVKVPQPIIATPFAPLPAFPGKVVDVAPGVVQFAHVYNCAVVEQPDGLVMLEGTTSPVHMDSVIAEVEKRFPGKKIKAVVTTSDAWPHFGGLRGMAARGIPIYAFERNRPILERFFKAPHLIEPDALSNSGLKPKVTYVSRPVKIGAGPTAVWIYPIRGEGSERMMAAYIPGQKLLYGSDLVQYNPDGSFFSPGYLLEIKNMIERERLDVETIFAMHATPRSWKEIVEKLAKG